MDTTGRGFGRSISDITRLESHLDIERRERQREALVSALELQVREKDAGRLIVRLRQWEEDKAELALMGFPGAGKPRPPVPPELVPLIQQLAPGLLERGPPASVTGSSSGSLAAFATGYGAAGPGGFGVPVQRAAPASSAAPPTAAAGYPGSSSTFPSAPGTQDAYSAERAEARLDSVLRSIAPELAEKVAAAGNVAGAAAGYEAAAAASAAASAPALSAALMEAQGGGAIAGLLRELVEEQRRLREQLAAATGGGTGGRGNSRAEAEYEDTVVSRAASRGRAAVPVRNRAAPSPSPMDAAAGAQRGLPPRHHAPPLSFARKSPPKYEREGPEGEDYFGGDLGGTLSPPKGPRGGAPGTGIAPKRPAFGRHAEGQMTAEERRKRGEARVREATERRRRALEEFREQSLAEKAAIKRDLAEQKHLRRELAYNRQGVVAAHRRLGQEGDWDGGLADVLASRPPEGPRYGYSEPPQPARYQPQPQHTLHANPHIAPVDLSLAHQLGHEAVELPGHANFFPVPRGMMSPQQIMVQEAMEKNQAAAGERGRPAAGNAMNAARERMNNNRSGSRTQSRGAVGGGAGSGGAGGGSRAASRASSREALQARLSAQQYQSSD